MKSFISYEGLPINSGGAHKIGRKSPKENYYNTLEFLNQYANTTKPKTIELTLYESKNKDYSIIKLLPKLCLKFGIPKMRNDGWLRTWSWSISQSNIDKGFEALENHNFLPNNPEGPLTLCILWHFQFKDPANNTLLPNQEQIPEIDTRQKNSQAYLRLSKKSTISVWFALPFEKLNEYEFEYIKNLNSCVPFKPSNNHWRLWKQSKKGNWIPKKIEIKTPANKPQ